MKTYENILRELDWPTVYLVSSSQFAATEGDKLSDEEFGLAAVHYPIITINSGLRGRALKNTIYHEIGHHLFPHWKHWKVEAFAERMAGGGGRGYYCKKYNHSVDEMPVRSELIKLARRAGTRMKKSNLNLM